MHEIDPVKFMVPEGMCGSKLEKWIENVLRNEIPVRNRNYSLKLKQHKRALGKKMPVSVAKCPGKKAVIGTVFYYLCEVDELELSVFTEGFTDFIGKYIFVKPKKSYA